MSSDAVFATKWDFLFSRVLIGVDRTTGVWSGSEPTAGQQMVCVWTTEDIATEALHVESWELRTIAVRDLLTLLPPGVGVIVDPERSTGLTASASYIANLKQLLVPFPAGTQVRLGPWDDLPDGVREVLAQAATKHDVHELRAFTYTIDDSPAIGCLAIEAAPGADVSAVVTALDSALSAAADPASLGLPVVNVVTLDDLPDEVRAAIGRDHVIGRPRRARRWRR